MPTSGQIAADSAGLVARRGWAPKTPQERCLYLVRSEVGELAESLLHVRWAEQSGDADRIERARAETAAELYDVVWNICDLANVLGIDPDDAARRQKQFNRDRVWEVAEPGQERGA